MRFPAMELTMTSMVMLTMFAAGILAGSTAPPITIRWKIRPDHGTHVAGDASAVTDNSIGVASIGFKSKIMPVKTIRDDFRNPNGSPFVVYGYEGIKYAADNGAKIINCSWGGGGYSLLGQEVINYATSLGALVVAAAGNNNSSGSILSGIV